MRVCAQSLALVASALLLSGTAWASNGIYLPPPPGGLGGEDSIETASGTRCRQSINSNGAYLDVGAAGSAAKPLPPNSQPFVVEQRDAQALAYVRLTVPIGKRPDRIDCSNIYRLEIERLKRELELLKMSAE